VRLETRNKNVSIAAAKPTAKAEKPAAKPTAKAEKPALKLTKKMAARQRLSIGK
jgi:hypothetical protein